ncbi:ESX secretion-associated protein EspG [Nocardia sp. BMG111209]|uniref:ESX secretion-associated protein EspG n=1 Tax=Nocardia sp. BMG111209 TaxID=1160137 RepID=UPI0018CBBC66|nr:ESX secretion-associated protein EspG [Nocardia sp. BMG111209]
MFTDHEFAALWQTTRDEFLLPLPFSFLSDIQFEDDYQREMRRIREQSPIASDPAVHRFLADITAPDVKLIVQGGDVRYPDDPKQLIRLLAARRENRGYLVSQLPGATVEHSAGFTVVECDPIRLADVVVAALPVTSAGRISDIAVPVPDNDGAAEISGVSTVWDTMDDGPGGVGEFLRARAGSIGTIEISQGITHFGPRGRTARGLVWRDHLDDGRYVVVDGSPILAYGSGPERFVGLINTEIAAIIRAIKDERR